MAVHNAATREIVYKVAYHGPGMCGKTTNLRFIYNTLPGRQVGNFLVLDTAVERTLYYDFLPVVIPLDDDYKVRFHLYTVPGQAYYDASRKLVLRGVDGVVFVADSRGDRMAENEESLAMLKRDLTDVGLDYATVPLIMQYNKRDLANVIPADLLTEKLNERGVRSFGAVARDGVGVFETLSAIADLVTGRN
ncbi:MAG: GTPase domain-containing protein [Candidatus Coatesbacteria bacterium]